MSMNLHLDASIEAVSKIRKHTICDSFGLWQTPTNDTRAILKSSDIKQAYIDWAKKREHIDTIPIYADDDFWQEREPIRYEEVNNWKEHVEALEAWLKEHEGWDIEWYEM